MRRLTIIAPAVLLLATIVAPAASADTGPTRTLIEFDRVTAEFAFSEEGRDFIGQILIDRDTATAAAITSFFFFSGVNVPCDNGTPDDPSDDFEGQDLIDFTANEASPTTLSIDDKLRTASATGVGTGQRLVMEPCSGEQTRTTETVAWTLELTSAGPTSHSTQVEKFPNDDGTVTTQTIKIVQRPASGSIAFAGMSLAVAPAAISHITILEATH